MQFISTISLLLFHYYYYGNLQQCMKLNFHMHLAAVFIHIRTRKGNEFSVIVMSCLLFFNTNESLCNGGFQQFYAKNKGLKTDTFMPITNMY